MLIKDLCISNWMRFVWITWLEQRDLYTWSLKNYSHRLTIFFKSLKVLISYTLIEIWMLKYHCLCIFEEEIFENSLHKNTIVFNGWIHILWSQFTMSSILLLFNWKKKSFFNSHFSTFFYYRTTEIKHRTPRSWSYCADRRRGKSWFALWHSGQIQRW